MFDSAECSFWVYGPKPKVPNCSRYILGSPAWPFTPIAVGKLIPICAPVTGASLFSLSLIMLMPKRKSLIRLLLKTCVSVMLPKRLWRGISKGKFRLFKPGSPPVWMPKESAPKGSKVSEFDQKNRSDRRSLPPRNSRSQFAVNWLSVNFPGFVTTRGSGVRQGVAGDTLVGSGYRYPPAPAPN